MPIVPYIGDPVVYVEQYGVFPDQDSATQLIAMRDALIAAGQRHWTIQFGEGDYYYTNNRWTRGLKDYTIAGRGKHVTSLHCEYFSGGTLNENTQVFDRLTPFEPTTDGYKANPIVTDNEGYLFDTATAGDTTIDLLTAGEASNFDVGDRVFLHGYNQQLSSGWVPNLRYFDFATVTNISSGTITLDRPLSCSYDARWWDVNSVATAGKFFGAPRIISLDRADYTFPGTVKIRDVSLTGNTASSYGDTVFLYGWDVTVEDVITPSRCVVAFARHCAIRNSSLGTYGTGWEVDKLVGTCLIEDCDCRDAPDQGTGVQKLTLRRCTLPNLSTSPRNAILEDCIIETPTGNVALTAYAETYPVHSLLARNCRFTGNPDAVVDTQVTKNVTPDSITSTGGLVFNAPLTSGDALKVIQSLDYGFRISTSGTAEDGIVTEMYEDGSGNLVIEGTWQPTIEASDEVYWRQIQRSKLEGESYQCPQPLVKATDLTFNGIGNEVVTLRSGVDFDLTAFDYPSGDNRDTAILGRLARVIVDVHKADTSPDAVSFRIQAKPNEDGAGGNSDILEIDLATAGRRVFFPGGDYGKETGDTNEAAANWVKCGSLRMGILNAYFGGGNKRVRTTGDLVEWAQGIAVDDEDWCYVDAGDGSYRIYEADGAGTTGATEPTHTSSSASDGAVTWVWVASVTDLTLKQLWPNFTITLEIER